MRFIDTNILIYAATDDDPRKRDIARELIAHAIEVNHDGYISTQVLQEFCNAMLKKTKRTKEEIDGFLDYFRELVASDVTIDLVRRAVAVKDEYGMQFYDALIVATAAKLGCLEIVSEDLNPGQTYCGVAVVNPVSQGD